MSRRDGDKFRLLAHGDAICLLEHGGQNCPLARGDGINLPAHDECVASFLSLFLAGVDKLATAKAKVGARMEQIVNMSLYRVQIATRKMWSPWRRIWTAKLEPIIGELCGVFFALGPC